MDPKSHANVPECMFEAIARFDQGGACIGVNAKMKEILEFAGAEHSTINSFVDSLFHRDGQELARFKCLVDTHDGKHMLFRITGKGDNWKWCEFYATTESMYAVTIGALDVTAYMDKLDEIKENGKKFKNICDELKDAVSFTGPPHYVNKAWYELVGYTEDTIGSYEPSAVYVNPREREEYFTIMEEKGFVKDFPVRIRKKDGTELDCLFTSTLYRGEKGDRYYQGIIRDVTEQKRSVRLIEESEQKFRTLFEESKDAIGYLYTTGTLEVNKAWLDLFGYSSEELGAIDLKTLYANPRDRRRFFKQIEKHGSVRNFEVKMVRKDGQIIDCISTARVQKDEKGNPLYYQSILRDVTQMRRIIEQLRISEEKYRLLVENISEIMYSVDCNGIITYMSPVMESVSGWPAKEMVGKRFADVRFVHPLDIPMILKCFNGSEPVKNLIEFRFISRTDDVIWFKASIHTLMKKGKITGYQGILDDITKNVEAGQSIREIRERTSSFLDSATDSFFLFDHNLVLIEVNSTASREFNVPRHILLGKTLVEVLLLIKFPRAPSAFIEVLNSGKPVSIRGVVFGSSHFDFKVFKAGKGLGIIGSNITDRIRAEMMLQESRDELERRVEKRTADLNRLNLDLENQIAERKRTQEALALRESELASFLDNIPDIAWLKDTDSRYIMVNRTFSMLHNTISDHIKGLTDYELWPRSIAERYISDDITTMRTGKTLRVEEPLQTLTGRSMMIETIKGPIRDESGKIIGTVGIARDITERKNTECILKESEERYRTIFEHAGVMLIEMDFSMLETVMPSLRTLAKGDIKDYLSRNYEYYIKNIAPLIYVVDVNKKTLDMFGAKSKKSILKHFYDLNRDELFPFHSLIINAMIDNRPDVRVDFELTTLRGRKRYVTASATIPVKTKQYNRILVSITDISERKQFEDALRRAHEKLEQRVKERTAVLAETNMELEREIIERKTTESALRESEERYRTLFTTSIDAIFIVDQSMRYVDVNQSLLDLFGYSRSEILGSGWCMPFHDRSGVEVIKREITEKGYAFDTEVRFKRKDGVVLDGLATVKAWRDSAGEIRGYQGFYRDITEQKRAERILKYQAEFQELISKISVNFINIPVNMIDTAIEQTLKTLCEYVHVDHGFVYRNTEGGTHAVLNYEWRSEGFDRYDPDMEEKADIALEWLQSHIKKMDSIDFTELLLQPSNTQSEYCRSLVYREKSFISIPMVYNGTLTGFFGFDSILNDKTWDDDTISLLYFVGQMLENTLERKTAEKRIIEYQEKLRTIASELTLTEERERRRIAVELHDRIGQTLAVAKMKLQGLQKTVPSLGVTESLDEVCIFIEDAIHDTRLLVSEISPPVLYDLGFEAAIEWLVESVQHEHNIAARFKDNGIEKKLSHNMKVLLFQMVREILFNVVKHAHATKVNVTLKGKEKTVEIEVEDDGVGFDVTIIESKSAISPGFGLFSIRERLDHFGGSMSIHSHQGKGTRIVLISPVTQPYIPPEDMI